ncbi:MAG: hydroxysqualene dehydroxylase HpnE [Planctomycetota bacterium]
MTTPKSEIPNPKSAVVLGGGVAGIAAAVRLAEAGVRVTLVEMRPRLGGRATSIPDPASGRMLDNCQHVVMRCCTALLELYETLGVSERMVWHRKFDFVHADGTRASLEATRLPAPTHFALPFLTLKGLSWRDKFGIARAMHEVFWSPPKPEDRDRVNAQSFADWLAQRMQTPRSIERFWEPVVVGACNETLDRVAAGYALQVFREGFLETNFGYEMGLSDVPLVGLYDPAEAIIAKHGGAVLQASAKSLEYDAQSQVVRGVVLNDGTRLEADAYVSALPFDVLERAAGEAMKTDDPRLQRLGELEVSPIVGLHLWVRSPGGGPTMTLPHIALTGSPLHWVFDQGTDDEGLQHLHGVVSAAHDLVDQPNAEILDVAISELHRLVPGCVDAELVEGRVIKERRATFSCVPGVDALRPETSGPIANLLLAGDWCATGWPATMEGAARSGFAAARAVESQ